MANKAYSQEPQPYFASIGYSQLQYKETNTDRDANLDAVVLRLGQNFSRYFSGEVRAGFGTNGDALDDQSSQSLELDRYYGIYTKVGYPIGNVVFPYLTLGYTDTSLDFLQGETKTRDGRNGVSYGIGTDFKISERLEINLEYMSYIDKNNLEIRGAQISISAPFSD